MEKTLKRQNSKNLLKFIKENCNYISNKEQKYIENFLKNYDKNKEEFSEVDIQYIKKKEVKNEKIYYRTRIQ